MVKSTTSRSKKKSKRKPLPFVHLHVHDEHSQRDAVGQCEDYIMKAKKLGMPAFTITNHGSVGQFIRQYLKCEAEGMKNIFGCEVYINNNRRKLMKVLRKIDENKGKSDILAKLAKKREAYQKRQHLIILAKNEIGYRNLLKITSDAWINGFYYRPMTDFKTIKKHKEGLIILSACIGSEFGQFCEEGDFKGAVKLAKKYIKYFGDDFYFEIQLHDFKKQETYNKFILKLAKKLKVPVVITNDSHYMDKEDSKAQDTLLLIKNGNTWNDLKSGKEGVWTFETKQLWYCSEPELYKRWKKEHSHYITKEQYKEFVLNTVKVADKVEQFSIKTGNQIPYFCEPEKGLELLKENINKGWRKRKLKGKQGIERLRMELDTVAKLGYEHYFLIMEDAVGWCKKTFGEDSVGDGRGSGAGSLINYVLGITNVNPLDYDLIFERFINLGRDDVPDIDTDFSPDVRDAVKEYIINRWGVDHTASIGTYGTYKTRAVIGDVSSAFNIPVPEFRKITKGFEDDCDEHTWEELRELYPDFDAFCDKYPDAMEVASKLRFQVRNVSKHAAGVVITRGNIYDEIALLMKDGKVQSAWMEGMTRSELGKIGKVKFDLLGLKTLKILREVNKLRIEQGKPPIDWWEINYNDPKSLELAREENTDGVFQFESSTMRRMLRDAEVETLEDLSAISGLGRPGPLRAHVDKEYCGRASGKIDYDIHPLLRPITESTHGIMVYQEQIMAVSQVVGGFTLTEADRLRKLLVKAKVDQKDDFKRELQSVHEKFVKGGLSKGFSKDELEDMWDKMIQFSGYGFNKAHSISYARISLRCLYSKAHSPIEFFTALYNNTDSDYDVENEGKLEKYVNNAKQMGIKTLPPSINKSKGMCTIEGKKRIRFGISFIKGIGEKTAEAIVEGQPYSSFADFYKRVKKKNCNIGHIEKLIRAGCFDEIEDNRKRLLKALIKWKEEGKKGNLIEYISNFKKVKDYDEMEKLDIEREMIGFYLSAHPLDKYEKEIEDNGLCTIAQILRKGKGKLAASVQNVKKIITKHGDPMAFVLLTDQHADILDTVIFPNDWAEYEPLLKVGNLICIKLSKTRNKRDGSDSWTISNKDGKRQVILLEKLVNKER